jgi:hypothetical protein
VGGRVKNYANGQVKLNQGKRKIQEEGGSFHHQIRLTFKEETSKIQHLKQSLYGAETWILREVDQKYLESFEMRLEYH